MNDFKVIIEKSLAPFSEKKISREQLIKTFIRLKKDLCLFQIIDNEISIYSHADFIRGNARLARRDSLKFFLDQIAKKKPLPDCEFLVLTSDHANSDFPVFSTIRTSQNRNIAVPMGCDRLKNGSTPLLGWDRYISENYLNNAAYYPWKKKINKGIFRGTLRIPQRLQPEQWKEIDRGKLFLQAQKRPDLLDVEFTGIRGGFAEDFSEPLKNEIKLTPYIPLVKQQEFKYQVNVGANSGWADRMRILPFLNSVVLMHEVECEEFYSPLMKADEHYLPFAKDFSNLADVIEWARANDLRAKEIVENANAFAKRYITEGAMECFYRILLDHYRSILDYPLVRGLSSEHIVVERCC